MISWKAPRVWCVFRNVPEQVGKPSVVQLPRRPQQFVRRDLRSVRGRAGEVEVRVVPACLLLARRVYAGGGELAKDVLAFAGVLEAPLREGAGGDLFGREAVIGEYRCDGGVVHEAHGEGGHPRRVFGIRTVSGNAVESAVESTLPDVTDAASDRYEPRASRGPL